MKHLRKGKLGGIYKRAKKIRRINITSERDSICQ